jgi:hypothetical protein
VWYRYCQQQNSQALDPTKPGQNIPSGGNLEITVTSGNISMGPNDPPKQIQVKTDSGEQKSIYLLHGTPDGSLMFGDAGNLQFGSVDDFQKWLQSKSLPILPFVSCYGSKIVGGNGGGQELINAAGSVQVGTKTLPDGTEKIVFSQ